MKIVQVTEGSYFQDDSGVYHFVPRSDGGIRSSFKALKRLYAKKGCVGVILWINDLPQPIFAEDTIEKIVFRDGLFTISRRSQGIEIKKEQYHGLDAVRSYVAGDENTRKLVNEALFAEWH